MKKILLLLVSLLCGVSGAWAATLTLTSGSQILSGSFYNAAGASMAYGNWCTKCVTNSNPAVTLTFTDDLSGTGISNTSGYLSVYSTGTRTLTISVPSGCTISSYTFKGTPTAECNFTPAGGTAQSWALGSEGSVTVSDVNAQSTTIAFSDCGKDGNNECLIQGVTLTINYEASSYSVKVLGSSNTAAGVTYNSVGYGNGATIAASDISETDVTANAIEGENASVSISGSTITVTYTPNLTGLYVVNTSVEASTDAIVAGQWYILSQSRSSSNTQTDKTPVYDTGAGNTLKRAASGTSPSSLLTYRNEASTVSQYLIRFFKTGLATEDYGIQFATGNFWNGVQSNATTPTSYLIYTASQTASTADFTTGWALNATSDGTTYGSKVDNNGPGSNISFWNSGENTGGSNNIWQLFPVTLDESVVRVADGTNDPLGTLGTVSGTTWTSLSAAGFAGLTVSGASAYDQSTSYSARCINIKPSAVNTVTTITMTAPEGYLIENYSLNARLWTVNCPYTVIVDGTTYNPGIGSDTNITSADVNAQTATFTIEATGSSQYLNWLVFKSWTINIKKSVNYHIMSGNSEVATSNNAATYIGYAPSVPDAKEGCTYTYYSDAACTSELSTITSGTTDVYVKYTYTSPFPFETADSYSAISKWYYLRIRPESGYNNYIKYVSGSNPNVAMTTDGYTTGVEAQEWAFVGDTDPYTGTGLTIYNRAAGNSLILASNTPDGDGANGGSTYATMEATGAKTYEVWYPEVSSLATDATDGFFLKTAGSHYLNRRSTDNLAFRTEEHDIGSTFSVVEATDITLTVNVKDGNGSTIYSKQIENVVSGTTYTLADVFGVDFVTYSPDTYTATSELNQTVDVTYTSNLPFQVSTEFSQLDDTNCKWYAIDMHSNQANYTWTWPYDESSNHEPTNITAPVVAKNSASGVSVYQLWCFMGDPFNGFKIYNHGADSEMTLRKETDGNTVSTMSTTDDNNLFKVYETTSDIENGFCLKRVGDTHYLNHYYNEDLSDYQLQGHESTDYGSTCRVFSPGSYMLNYLEDSDLGKIPFGSVGSYAYFEDAEALQYAVLAYQQILADPFNMTYGLFLATITQGMEEKGRVTMTDGGYYRFVSAYPDWVDGYRTVYYSSSNGTLRWRKEDSSVTQVPTIFKLTGSESGFTIYEGHTGKYLTSATGTLGETAETFVLDSTGPAQYNVKTGSENPMHANGHSNGSGTEGNLVAWTGEKNSCSAWYLVPVTETSFTLNNASDGSGVARSYATTCLPYDFTLPDGVTANTLETITVNGEQKYIRPTSIGTKVPAGTPVMLVGAEDAGTITATWGGDMSGVSVGTNILAGNYETLTSATSDDATTYLVLNKNSSGYVGFFKLKDGKTLKPYRAYIPYADYKTIVEGSGVTGFILWWDAADDDDLTDGISQLEGELQGAPVYDLSGRKVSESFGKHQLPNGLYIVNGKKVMVK